MSYVFLFVTLIVGIFQIEKLFKDTFKARPWIVFGLLIVVTIISFIVEYSNKQSSIEEKKIAKKESDKRDHDRDSIADARIVKSNKLIIDGIGEAIGKYSLGYDSAKKEIAALKQLIKDSANRKTTFIQGDNPLVTFCDEGVTLNYARNDSIAYAINICSFSAASIVKSLNEYSLVSNYQMPDIFKDLVYLKNRPLFFKNLGIPKEGKALGQYSIRIKSNQIKTLVILLKGNFTDSYGKNSQELDKVGYLDLVTKKYSLMASPYDDQVRELLKNKGAIQ